MVERHEPTIVATLRFKQGLCCNFSRRREVKAFGAPAIGPETPVCSPYRSSTFSIAASCNRSVNQRG